MANQPVVVVGVGIVSPIGLSLPETAASARARIARLREIQWRDRRFEPFIVGAVPDDGLPELEPKLQGLNLQYREARMLRLAHVALEEVLKPIAGKDIAVPLLLGLPEHHTTKPIDAKGFLPKLAHQAKARLDPALSVAVPKGRAAGLMAFRRAGAMLESNEAEFVLVGGVDSLIDLYVLGTLDMQGRIRTEVNSDGFSPGEGAAFLLLTREATAVKNNLKLLARVIGFGQGFEPGHLYAEEPYLGEGLAATFAALFDEAPPPSPIGCVFCSLNGERYWGKEFGVARLRNSAAFEPDHPMEHPAECFGDLGAAHGPALAALAIHGIQQGYRREPCLVYASSDYGDRAAILLGKSS
ncbi:MAG: beta-ketoacyl synthase N-terminal-like domain-containing protein [Proteobacteria bacterium]|nr:beta-ketoacyl synthase N-terminal-like domain-containing protein [Pseudomonadota bacterium]